MMGRRRKCKEKITSRICTVRHCNGMFWYVILSYLWVLTAKQMGSS